MTDKKVHLFRPPVGINVLFPITAPSYEKLLQNELLSLHKSVTLYFNYL